MVSTIDLVISYQRNEYLQQVIQELTNGELSDEE